MSMEIHDRLSEHMTATMDCERAYRLGVQDAFDMREVRQLDLDAAATKCAKRAMTAPQNTAFDVAAKPQCAKILSDGAPD